MAATPADNLSTCARSLELLTSIMSAFSSEISKLISAVGKTKSNAGGGKKSGSGGGDSDPEVTREIEANIKETRKNNKKLLDTQLSDADRENKESLRFARAQQAEIEERAKEGKASYDEAGKRDIKIFKELLKSAENEKEEREKHAYDVAVRENARVADLAKVQLAAIEEQADAALAAIKKEEDYDLKRAKEQGSVIAKKEEEQRKRDEKQEAAVIKGEQDYWKSVDAALKEKTAAEAKVIKIEEDYLLKRAKEQGAAVAKKEEKKVKDSSNFSGAKNFDPKEFLNSLKGGLVSGIVGAATQGFAVFQKTRQNVSNATGGKGAPGGAAAAAIGPIIGAAGAAAGAIGALSGGMMALFEMVGKFVGALDPALMQQLSLAFENLSAVIGIGLRPIITMAVVIIKAFGDALVPVMKQLEPVMTKLSMVIINMVVPYILVWADQIETLIPFIEALIPIIGLFGDLLLLSMKVLIPPFKVLAGVLMIVVGVFDLVAVTVYMLLAAFYAAAGELKSWVPGFGDSSKADKQMAKDMVEKSKASANSAGEAMKKGANLIIDGVENSLGIDSTNKKEKPKPGGAEGAAAKGASFSGVADLGKNMMQAAFGSSTANVANEQLNQQKQINQSIEKIGGWLFGWAKPKEPAAGVRK